jgi:hypothetical protein
MKLKSGASAIPTARAAKVRIKVPANLDLPETFNLTFDGGRSIRPCRFLWQSDNEMAVEFL